MNLRNLFRLFSVLHMIVGLTWLLAPNAMSPYFGVDADAFAAFLYQQLGALNIAMAVLYFQASGLASSSARQAVVTFVVVAQTLSAIAYIPSLLNGTLPGASWFGVAFSIVTALAFGYFGFIRPEASVKAGFQS